MNAIQQTFILTQRFGKRTLRQPANRLLGVCIILCTCIAASLSLFTTSVQTALENDIANFLGAPLVVRSEKPLLAVVPDIDGLLNTVKTSTLTTGAMANQRYQSISLKGVSGEYPLQGDLIIKRDGKEARAYGKSLAMDQAWLDRRAMDELKVDIGDQVQIGEVVFSVAGEVMFEPDRLTQLQRTLPRVIVSLAALDDTGVLVGNERVDYRVLFAGGETALRELESQLPTLIGHHHQVLKPSAGHHPLARISLRAERMTGLVLVFIMLMCGAAAAMLADYSVARFASPTAVLRCMGLPRHAVAVALCLQLLLLALVMSVVGFLLAWLLHPALLSLMEPHMQLSVAKPLLSDLIGPIGVGLVMIVAFVIPNVQRLSTVPVASVLRGTVGVQKRPYVTTAFASALVVALLWYSSDNIHLTLMLLAAVSLLVTLSISVGWGLSALSAQVHHLLRGPLKIAVRSIGRTPRRHITPLVSIAITMMAILMTLTLRGSFLESLQTQRLESDGNYIFTGLPADQKTQFEQQLRTMGAELKGLYPTVTARLVQINHVAVTQAVNRESETRELIRSKVRLSWAETKPQNNTLVQGDWPTIGSNGVSVEEEVMSDLGLRLGDELGFEVGDALVTVRVTSVRKYNGSHSSMMFWFMLSPDTLQAYDHHYMGGILLKKNAVSVLRVLARTMPQVRITDLERQISRIRTVMIALTRLMNAVLVLLLSGAALLIITSSFVGASQQKKQLGLMRTFGLRRQQGFIMYIAQQLTLALVACVVGIVGAQAIAGTLFHQLFHLPYRPDWVIVLLLSLSVSAAFALLGCVFAYFSMRAPVRLSLT